MPHSKIASAKENLLKLLEVYQSRTEDKIKKNISSLGGSGKLREACEYALLNGGKRFRPALVFMVADGLKQGCDVTSAALAIEYFHTASLIADDLPCMDDDDTRRNRPSVHKVYGEATALLASYALIAAGYGAIATCVNDLVKTRPFAAAEANYVGILALENVCYNTGLDGATGGQFLDIFPPDLTLETLRDVIHKKTVTLFEISFVFGWLFGGGDPKSLNFVKKAASHFGMAFQIADDLGDVEQDAKNGRKINMAGVFGVESAKKMFHEEITGYRQMLKMLGLETPELLGLAFSLEASL